MLPGFSANAKAIGKELDGNDYNSKNDGEYSVNQAGPQQQDIFVVDSGSPNVNVHKKDEEPSKSVPDLKIAETEGATTFSNRELLFVLIVYSFVHLDSHFFDL